MPVYTFENTKTGKVYDEMMSISEKEDFLDKNKHIKQLLTTINIVGGVQGITHKNDGGWNDNIWNEKNYENFRNILKYLSEQYKISYKTFNEIRGI